MSEPTPTYYNNSYKGIKIDPYRVCKIYNIGGGPREQAIKYLLRGTNKSNGPQTELEIIEQVQNQLNRWREMIVEDGETKEKTVFYPKPPLGS